MARELPCGCHVKAGHIVQCERHAKDEAVAQATPVPEAPRPQLKLDARWLALLDASRDILRDYNNRVEDKVGRTPQGNAMREALKSVGA